MNNEMETIIYRRNLKDSYSEYNNQYEDGVQRLLIWSKPWNESYDVGFCYL